MKELHPQDNQPGDVLQIGKGMKDMKEITLQDLIDLVNSQEGEFVIDVEIGPEGEKVDE